jgi:hypothetical protein
MSPPTPGASISAYSHWCVGRSVDPFLSIPTRVVRSAYGGLRTTHYEIWHECCVPIVFDKRTKSRHTCGMVGEMPHAGMTSNERAAIPLSVRQFIGPIRMVPQPSAQSYARVAHREARHNQLFRNSQQIGYFQCAS